MRRTACSGKQEISKSAFLNMIGDAETTNPAPPKSVEANERARVLISLNYCNGDKARAAAILGITPDTLERKLAIRRRPETGGPTSSARKFYESIKTEWSVGGLDVETMEVCSRINLQHGTNVVSSVVRKPA